MSARLGARRLAARRVARRFGVRLQRARRAERGSATLLAVAGLLLLCLVLAAVGVALVFQVASHRVQGAADLVAVTAAAAHVTGVGEPCAAARRAAAAEHVELASCELVGDELAFAVSVTTRERIDFGGWSIGPTATAHAGARA